MHRRARLGFAYLWVIVIIAIIATLAAVAAPSLATIDDNVRVTSAVTTLRGVGTGIINFHTAVTHFPGKVSQLTNRLRLTDLNSCGTAMVAGDTARWTANAPFLTYMSPTTGVVTPIGTLKDAIFPTRAARDSMYIEMPAVLIKDAARFKALVDSNATPAGDTVTVVHGQIANMPDTTTIRMRLFKTSVFNSC